jgi:hypothetical protein
MYIENVCMAMKVVGIIRNVFGADIRGVAQLTRAVFSSTSSRIGQDLSPSSR